MNKINELLKQHAKYFEFDKSDFAFYESFEKTATAQEFEKKYQDFVNIFASFNRMHCNSCKKIENVKKSIAKNQNKDANKQLIEKVEEYKQEGFTRSKIAEKLGIDMKKLLSLENLAKFYESNN